MRTRRAVLIGSITILSLLGVSLAPGQGKYNKAAFEKVMEQANREARVLLGSLVAGNWEKAGSAAESIEKLAGEMRVLTPKRNPGQISHFQSHADSLAARAARLAAAAKAKDGQVASETLGRMVAECMHCHAHFRE